MPALQRYNEERARHEKIKADAAEFDLDIKRGQYLPRTAVQGASAIAVAAVVQSMRSLGDKLEREFKLPPEVAEAIEATIDEALADIGKQFKAMSG